MIQTLQKILNPSVMRSALEQFGEVSPTAFLLYALGGILLVGFITALRMLLKRKVLISDVLTAMVLVIYGSVMLQLTLVCRESGSRIGIELELFHGLMGPDNAFHWLMWAYAILNCLLFIPYGFALSLFSFINDRKTGIQLVTITLLNFMTSMIIECAQLITQRGYFEIQDLVINTLGGILGWILFRIIFAFGGIFIHSKKGDTEC